MAHARRTPSLRFFEKLANELSRASPTGVSVLVPENLKELWDACDGLSIMSGAPAETIICFDRSSPPTLRTIAPITSAERLALEQDDNTPGATALENLEKKRVAHFWNMFVTMCDTLKDALAPSAVFHRELAALRSNLGFSHGG